jgi:flagellar biosynthesis regulator FlbT
MDAQLPPAPSVAPAAYPLPAQPQPQMPQGMLPRGRPPADPEVAEAKAQRHQERRRVEAVMPKKALDSKVLIYRMRRGRIVPGAKPVLSVLVSELEEATRDGQQEPEDYLCQRLGEKLNNKDQTGSFQCVTVDRRGGRISDVPPFEISLVDEGEDLDEDDNDDGQGDEGADGFDPGEPEDYDYRGHHPVPPPLGPPPSPTHIDLAAIDDVARRNREEEKNKSSESMTLMLGMFQAMQAQQAQSAQQTTQMLMAFMQQSQQKSSESSGTMVALITALAPVIAPLLQPKPQDTSTRDLMLPILMKLMEKEKQSNPAEDWMKTLPAMMQEVTRQQMALQGLGAESVVKMQSRMSEAMMTQALSIVKDQGKKPEPEEKESTFGSIAKMAAAVLPSLMGGQQPQAEPGFAEQQVPALPAPAVIQPTPEPEQAPAPRPPRTAKKPTPEAAEEQPKPTPRQRPPQTEESKIRGCMQTIRKLENGEIPAIKRWDALTWVRDRAPKRVLEAIVSGSTERVMQECASAVLPDQELLTWISDSEHIEFLTDALGDVKLLVSGPVPPEYMNSKVAALTAYQAKNKPPTIVPTEPQAAAAEPAPAEPATQEVVIPPEMAERPSRGKRAPPEVVAEVVAPEPTGTDVEKKAQE